MTDLSLRYVKMRMFWFNSWSDGLKGSFLSRLNTAQQALPSEQLLKQIMHALVDLKMKVSDLPPSMLQYFRDFFSESMKRKNSSTGDEDPSAVPVDKDDILQKWLTA